MTGQPSGGHDALVSLLSQTRQIFYLDHQEMDATERDLLWNERAKQLTEALFSVASGNAAERSRSSIGASPMTRTRTAPVRRRSVNHDANGAQTQESIPMSRKRSYIDRTSSEHALVPSSSTSMDRYQADGDAPFNQWCIGNPTKMQRIPSGQRKPVPQIQTRHHVGFVETGMNSASTSSSSSPRAGVSSSAFASPLPTGASFTFPAPTSAPTDHHQHHPTYPGVPDMNRQNSLGGGFCDQIADITLASPADDSRPSIRRPSYSHRPASFEYDEITQPFHDELGPSVAAIPIPTRRPGHGHVRRHSNHGATLRSRMAPQPPTIREQPSFASIRDRQLSTSPRNIMPKPSPDGSASSSLSTSSPLSNGLSHQRIKIVGADGKSTEKYALPKMERQKKIKEKNFFCDQCNKRPEGFRGAHELQRHVNAQHARVRKVWICVDGSPKRDKLRDCKYCQAQKAYPAYYNAAAHLRRIHFKPKSESGKKGVQKKRAGMSGGKYPPMEELKKYWMKEIELVDGQMVEEEQPDFEMVDEDEIGLFDAPAKIEKQGHGPRTGVKREQSDVKPDLTQQAAKTAELAVPDLSSTLDTVASSFNDDFLSLSQETLSLDPLSASGLLSTASVAATAGSSEMQQSVCSTDGADALDGGLTASMPNLDFSDLFQGLDAPLSRMPFDEAEFQMF